MRQQASRWSATCCLILGLAVIASPAAAQVDDSSTSSTFSSTSVSTTTSAITVGGVILTVYALTPKAKATLIRDYMEQNRAQLQEGLAQGGGDAIQDLATLFGIPAEHQARFGQRLRAQRTLLGAALNKPHISEQDALRFAQHIHDQLRQDAALSAQIPATLL